MQKLGPDTVCDGVDYLAAILSRIDVHAERPFAKWHVDDLDDGIGDSGNIRVREATGIDLAGISGSGPQV